MKSLLYIFIGLELCLPQEFEVRFYYAYSQVETYSPLTETLLKNEPMYQGVIRGLSAERLFEMATTPLKKSAFDPQSPRLLIYANGAVKPIVVDRFSVAKQGDLEYFVDPNIFSYLESGLYRGRIPHKRDYTHEEWQSIHDMHQRVPAMVEISQRGSDDILTVFVMGVFAVFLIFILILSVLRRKKGR